MYLTVKYNPLNIILQECVSERLEKELHGLLSPSMSNGIRVFPPPYGENSAWFGAKVISQVCFLHYVNEVVSTLFDVPLSLNFGNIVPRSTPHRPPSFKLGQIMMHLDAFLGFFFCFWFLN